jgi:hypothetical protein
MAKSYHCLGSCRPEEPLYHLGLSILTNGLWGTLTNRLWGYGQPKQMTKQCKTSNKSSIERCIVPHLCHRIGHTRCTTSRLQYLLSQPNDAGARCSDPQNTPLFSKTPIRVTGRSRCRAVAYAWCSCLLHPLQGNFADAGASAFNLLRLSCHIRQIH